MDNDQFTEEHKLEAWRQLHASHLQRQTTALESIRSSVFGLLLIALIGVIVGLVVGLQGSL